MVRRYSVVAPDGWDREDLVRVLAAGIERVGFVDYQVNPNPAEPDEITIRDKQHGNRKCPTFRSRRSG